MGLHDKLSEFAEQIDEQPRHDADERETTMNEETTDGCTATDSSKETPMDDAVPTTDAQSAGASESDSGRAKRTARTDEEWTAVETPTEKTLYGVVQTTAGAFAVGEAGLVLSRGDDGWSTVVSDGPGANRNPLLDMAVSADGERVWFCGGSGALGCYDVTTARKYDFSAPDGKTSTWEAVAIAGERGDERLRVANGSGEVLVATVGEDLCPTIETVVKPGGGSTISSLTFDDSTCYAVDTSGNALEETDDDWTDIGIENAQVNFFDVCADRDSVYVAGGDGLIYRFDRSCQNWTPTRIASGSLQGVGYDGNCLIVVGSEGIVRERYPDRGWSESETPVEMDLYAVAPGDVDTAVGAEGTVIER